MDSGKIKKGLGRGLSSLIGETKSVSSVNKLSVSDLISNKFQPRKIFDGENLEDLTNSIKRARNYPANYCEKICRREILNMKL